MLVSSSSGRKFQLDSLFGQADSVTIGRNSSTELTMAAMVGDKGPSDSVALTLSRKHAKLTVKDGSLGVEDFGTINGTYVNNRKLLPGKRAVLSHKDVISLGGPQSTNVSGTTTRNPFTLTVVTPDVFLARHVAPGPAGSTLQRAATATATAAAGQSDPMPEMFRFNATGSTTEAKVDNDPLPSGVRPYNAAPAAAATPAFNDEVIDLTGVDDTSPEKHRAPRQRQQQRSEDHQQNAKRMRMPEPEFISDASPPTEEPAFAPGGAGGAGPSNAANDIVAKMMEQFTCPICQEIIVAAHGLVPCAHSFCGACLAGWLGQGKKDCPSCRKVTTAPPVRQHNIDNAIEALTPQLSEEDKAAMHEKKQEWEKNKATLQRALEGGGPRQQQLGRERMLLELRANLATVRAGMQQVLAVTSAAPGHIPRSEPVRMQRRFSRAPQAPSGSGPPGQGFHRMEHSRRSSGRDNRAPPRN